MRSQDINKSKSFIRKMFNNTTKESRTTRCFKPSSEELEAECFSESEPAMLTPQDAKTLRMFVGTWNVGGKSPHSDLNLDHFLQVHDQPDIYVLGFQEVVPLNAGNVLVIEDSEPAAKWLSLINKSLNKSSTVPSLKKVISLDPVSDSPTKGCKLMSSPSGSHFFQKYSLKIASKQFRTISKKKLKMCNCVSELERKNSRDSCFRCQTTYLSEDDLSSEEDEQDVVAATTTSSCYPASGGSSRYSLVVSKQMVGIFLTIWVKDELVQHISHLRSSYTTRGIMGCLGNKGCISVSMSLYRTSFCFICSHLASGEKEGDELRRNLDVIEILKNTQFPKRCKIPYTRVPDRILEHDRVIWLGDLNYRIALSYTETRMLLQRNDWDTLLSKDQLRIEREAGRVFNGWKEGKIYFAPTYKYRFNSDTYFSEANTSKHKRRTPAWCDRILWNGQGIKQLSYLRRDSNEFRFSDHRPVCATFMVNVFGKKGLSSNDVKVEIEELLPASRK